MAGFDYRLGFDTSLDPSGLKDGLDKALSHAESEVLRSAAKQTAAFQKAADEQKEIHRKAAKEEIAERKKSLKEQIAAIKSRPDLTQEAKQQEIEAVKEAEQAKIDAINASLKQQVASVQAATNEKIKAVRDGARQQARELQQGNRGSLRSIEDFGKGATQAMGGIGASMKKLAMGPVGIGAAVALAGKQVKRFLNQTAAAWRVEEQAQIALAAAARNNPYLNDRGVHQLRQFANEMQRLTGIDNVQVMGAQTRLAALGRSQQEIEQIVRTAADIAATGLMSYDQAVDELSQSFSGFTRRLERMFPELKSLTEEAKMAGGAVSMIAESVSGMAEQAMRSGTGSVQAFNNAMEAMRRSIGQDWEQAMRPFRIAMTDVINVLVEARERAREYREAMREAAAAGEYITVSQQLRAYEAEMDRIQNRLAEAQRIAGQGLGRNLAEYALFAVGGNFARMAAGVGDIDMTNAAAWEAYLTRQVEALQGTIESYGKAQAQIDRAIAMMQRSATDAGIAGTEVAERYAEAAQHFAAEALKILQQRGSIEAAMRQLAFAEERGEVVERERERIELEREHAKIRAENLEYLEQEIEMITQKAQIEGRGTRTLEVQRRVLSARINAYANLVRQIGAAGEAERRTLEELQREYLRLEIETANRLQEDNRQALENRRREIETMAELEGRATDSIRTQNELLDANVNAYQNQMRILRDLIDGTREEESARRAALEVQWRQYAQEKQTAMAQRARLQEMIRLQGEVNQQVRRMHEAAKQAFGEQSDRDWLNLRLFRAGEESKSLEEDRVAAAIRADNIIAEHRRELFERTLKREREQQKEAIEYAERENQSNIGELRLGFFHWQQTKHSRAADEINRIYSEMMGEIYGDGARERIQNLSAMQIAELEKVRDAWMEAYRERRTAEARMVSGDDRASIESGMQLRLNEIYRQFADKRVEIEREAAKRIREENRQTAQEMLASFNSIVGSMQSIANSIGAIWTNSINRQKEDRLRANDAMEQSDEERAANERRIMKKAALERYRAELFAWSANVTFATAQAGLAALTAFAEGLRGGGPAAIAVASIKKGLAVAAGAAQVAAIASAKPTPPRFHTGGQVPGRIGQDVQVLAQGREIFIQPAQWKNTMQAMANLANMAYRPAAAGYNVTVHNNMGREARVSQRFDADGLTLAIDKIVSDGLANGRYDGALDRREARNKGAGVSTW